jgi:hypothetical protein
MKVKRANRLMSVIDEIWVIHLQKVDTLLSPHQRSRLEFKFQTPLFSHHTEY